MARMIDASGGGNDTHEKGTEIKISAQGEDRIDLPADMSPADAEMTRDGADLVLTSADGSSVVVEGYFTADPAPVIAGAGGASLSPELVNSFLASSPEYAQAATVSDAGPVGAIEEIKGNASVTHADGTTETLTLGSPIYEGDVIQTDAQGAVNVVFVDETSMAVSANARMAIDDYSFDPATESGTTNFSVLRGVFVFTSGLIGRDDPDDVHIDTPVGSIGIRGTIIAGNINPDGESEITVVEGAIVVKNAVMEKTLAAQFETVRLGGLESDMHDMGVLSAKAVGTAFGAVSDVAPSLFNAINDAAKEQGQDGDAAPDAAEEGAEETGEGEGENTQPDAADEPVQDMQLNQMNAPFSDDTFKEAVVKSASGPETAAADTVDAAIRPVAAAAHDNSSSSAANNAPTTPYTERPANAGDNTGAGGNGTSGGGTISGPAPALELTTGTNAQGVSRIGDNIGNRIGYAVTGVGDANGDGYADIMFSNNTSDTGQNHSYVAYGGANGITSRDLGDSGTSTPQTSIQTAPDPTRVGVINNMTPSGMTSDFSHGIVVGIGDYNNNGTMDYLVAQELNDTGALGSGIVQIVDGSGVLLRSLMGLDSLSELGDSVAALGDINNDGYADIIIGAPGAASGMDTTGKAFVVYGASGTTALNLATMTGQGRIIAGTPGDRLGESVAGIGDFDGDGYADYAIGVAGYDYDTGYNNEGAVLIRSGKTGNPIINVHSQLDGHNFGSDVIGLGDINGDGKSDVMMAGDGNSRTGYILFGGSTTSIGNVDTMSGSSGFKFNAGAGNEILGGGAAGDFNGDGLNDFVVAVSNGLDADIYVVYGHSIMNAVGADGALTVDALQNPEYAFKMKYTGGATYDFEFSSAGDTNGDGFDDLVIGIGDADSGNGEVLVVNGREGGDYTYVYDGAAEDAHLGDNSIKASGHEQIVMGSAQNDNLYADIYTDIAMNGGRGEDNMIVRDNSFFSIDGGFGLDTLRLTGTNSMLDLSAIGSERLSHVETLQFSQAGQKIVLTVENIFNLLKSSDDGTLKISFASTGFGDDGLLQIVSDNNHSGSFVDQMQQALGENTNAGNVSYTNGGTYQQFDIGGYTLYIDNAIADTATVGITP